MSKEKINAYKEKRKETIGSREAAAGLMGMSDDKLERIENGKQHPNAQDILIMSETYKAPELCNHFCHFDCEIGQKYVPEIRQEELPYIVMELLSGLYESEELGKLIIKIAGDNEITDDEIDDLVTVQFKLEKISMAIEALQLCIERKLGNDELSRETYEKAYKTLAEERK